MAEVEVRSRVAGGKVIPLPLRDLPHVSAHDAAASRWAGRRLTEPDASLTVDLGPVGPVRISFESFGAREIPSREELLLLDRDGRRGRLTIDRRMALALVSATLGRGGDPPILRPLGAAERGVLAALVATCLAPLGDRVTVTMDAAVVLPGDRREVSVAMSLETPAMKGRARVDLPMDWLSLLRPRAACPSALAAASRRICTKAHLELAATHLPALDWSGAGVGDAVVFDGTPSLSPHGRWPIILRIGEYATPAMLDDDGTVSNLESFRLARSRIPPRPIELSERTPKESAVMDAQSNDHNRAVLAAAPIEVVAEVGRLTLRGDEVLGLGPGSVLAFGDRGRGVVLLAGGAIWAKGELVDVEGELGVRITELVGA